jgi:hypothetical protein
MACGSSPIRSLTPHRGPLAAFAWVAATFDGRTARSRQVGLPACLWATSWVHFTDRITPDLWTYRSPSVTPMAYAWREASICRHLS